MGLLRELENALDLRYHRRSCNTCAFFRIRNQGEGLPYVSVCLLLGRSMGLSRNWVQVADWSRERVCDGWLPRPRHVKADVKVNPHFHDPYISRETIEALRQMIFNIVRERGPRIELEAVSDVDDAL